MQHLRYSLLFLCLFSFSWSLSAKQIPLKSDRLVNDYVNLLTSSEQQRLENKLVAYDDSTSTQIAIVIESSLDGDEIFDYSYRLAEAWGIGRDGKDNGILIYIALQDRALYIQTGYGVEGFLTDAMASRIIDQIITPAFRREAYFQGLDEGTTVIMQLGSGEYENTGLEKDASGSGLEALFILMFIILVVVILANIFNRGDDWDDWDDDGGYHGKGKYDYDQYGRPKRRRGRSGGGECDDVIGIEPQNKRNPSDHKPFLRMFSAFFSIAERFSSIHASMRLRLIAASTASCAMASGSSPRAFASAAV